MSKLWGLGDQTYIQIDVVYDELKIYSSNSLSNTPVQDTLQIVTISLRCGKKYR